MQIDLDVRLAAAAGGAARYFADAAGLPHDAIDHLQTAVVAACEEAFEDVSKDQPNLKVTLTWLMDRIEVAVCHKGAFARHPGGNVASAAVGRQVLEGIDTVQQDTRDGMVVTRLTKFVKHGAAST